MENKKFIEELNKSNQVANAKQEIQNVANNVGAVLSMLQSLPGGFDIYHDSREEFISLVESYCNDIDKLVDALRTTQENKKS